MHLALILALAVVGLPAAGEGSDPADPSAEVRETEAAFARTMADRDHGAFVTFLDDEAVFFAGSVQLRGKGAVAEAWKKYFETEAPPFSWAPEDVAVLDSGNLALSSGPVYDPEGQRIGTFTSVWRRAADGRWRIVLDKGCPTCACSAAP
ncbi:MAG: nuclear transport factor 2 family protein [Acidobacteria bacterium]|nr:nuclear transport factor 2 family protein [Acidobacteriota bacterium]